MQNKLSETELMRAYTPQKHCTRNMRVSPARDAGVLIQSIVEQLDAQQLLTASKQRGDFRQWSINLARTAIEDVVLRWHNG